MSSFGSSMCSSSSSSTLGWESTDQTVGPVRSVFSTVGPTVSPTVSPTVGPKRDRAAESESETEGISSWFYYVGIPLASVILIALLHACWIRMCDVQSAHQSSSEKHEGPKSRLEGLEKPKQTSKQVGKTEMKLKLEQLKQVNDAEDANQGKLSSLRKESKKNKKKEAKKTQKTQVNDNCSDLHACGGLTLVWLAIGSYHNYTACSWISLLVFFAFIYVIFAFFWHRDNLCSALSRCI